MPNVMEDNVSYDFEDEVLVIKIDTKKRLRRSASGKNTVIATTGGNIAIGTPSGDIIKLGLNCYIR